MAPVMTHPEKTTQSLPPEAECSLEAPETSGRNSNTTAVVVGGTKGVGKAIAKRLAVEGCTQIIIVGRTQEQGERAAREIGMWGADVFYIRGDLSTVKDCVSIIDTTIDFFGTVNTVINAAGAPVQKSLLSAKAYDWMMEFELFSRGPFFLMQRFAQHLIQVDEAGSFLSILSPEVYCGTPDHVLYAAATGATATMTKNMAHSLRRWDIRCNAILQGEGITDESVAALAAFLVSPEAGATTGSLMNLESLVSGAPPG